MRYLSAALLAMAALPLCSAPVEAQGLLPFTAEARVGMGLPVDDFAAGAEPGYLLEATAKVSPLPFVTVYAGWSFADFGSDGEGAVTGLDTSVLDSGYRVGGELSVPLAGLLSGVAPYGHLGLIFNKAEIEVQGDGTNTLSTTSDRTRGFEAGAGIRVGLAPLVSLVPEVRYRSYKPDFMTAPTVQIANEVRYLSFSLGAALHF